MCQTLDIAVITVCFNCEDEIEKTIDSVYHQKSNNYEYIIQDGLSSDNTVNKAVRYKVLFEDAGIEYTVNSQEDKGIYHAMNLAAAKCRAKYLLFLNAGDVLCHENVFNKLIEASRKSDADVFYGDTLMIDQSGTRLFLANMQLITRRMPFTHQACFISKDQFLSHMYNLKYSICGDYDLILRLYEKQCSFEYLNTIVCMYDMGGISSHAYVKKRKEHEEILDDHQLNRTRYKKSLYITEAYIKTIASRILPNRLQNRLREFYMNKVKHYKYWNGEIY